MLKARVCWKSRAETLIQVPRAVDLHAVCWPKRIVSELAQLPSRLVSAVQLGAGTSDPFGKVKALIADMTKRLESEAQPNADMAEAEKGIAQSAETRAAAEEDLAIISKNPKGDTDSFADLRQMCMTKAQDFEEVLDFDPLYPSTRKQTMDRGRVSSVEAICSSAVKAAIDAKCKLAAALTETGSAAVTIASTAPRSRSWLSPR